MQGLSGTINDIVQNSVPLLDGLKSQYGIDLLKNWRNQDKDFKGENEIKQG